MIDNTLASPYLIQPLRHGADIVVHSATKFIGGHGTSIGGVIVDGGSFDYVGERSLPGLHRARPELPRPRVLAAARRAAPRAVHPQGAPPVPARPRRRDLAVQRVPVPAGPADVEPPHGAPLAERAGGRRVARGARRGRAGSRYPGLPSSKWHDRAEKYPPNGQGAIIAFELKGGVEAGRNFIDSLELFSHLANVGDVRSLAIHPASTTHSQLDIAEQQLDRRDAGPRAALDRDRDPRRHPRRSRRRLPRREVGLIEPRLPRSSTPVRIG